MSNFQSDKNNNQTTTAEGGIVINKNDQRNIDALERMRRLIPYMTFYIPTSRREYLPTSPYGPINKPMVNFSVTKLNIDFNVNCNKPYSLTKFIKHFAQKIARV